MELEENYPVFQDLNAEIISIAQIERDPEMLPRITEFVHNSFPIVADPDQITRDDFEIFSVYLIDREGIVRTHIPGDIDARPRLDIILRELAKLEGVDPPSFKNVLGHIEVDGVSSAPESTASSLRAEDIINVRWMWSQNGVAPGDRFKLAFVTNITDGYHVYGPNEERMIPFRVDLDLPDGVQIVESYKYPKPEIKTDPFLKVDLTTYEEVVPMPVILLEVSEDLRPGEYIAKATVRYQACNDKVCHPPTTKVITLPLHVWTRDAERTEVAGSEEW